MLVNLGGIVLTWVGSVLVCFLIARGLNEVGRNMSWYGRPQWVFLLYVIPTVIISMGVLWFHAKYYHKVNYISTFFCTLVIYVRFYYKTLITKYLQDIDVFPWTLFQIYYDAYHLIWTLVLIFGIIVRIRSSFIALLWVVFPAVGSILNKKLFPKNNKGTI